MTLSVQPTLHERALKALWRYAASFKRPARKPEPAKVWDDQSVDEWEKKKVPIWKKCGRLTADGTLRVSSKPIRHFTAKSIRRIFSNLSLTEAYIVSASLYGDTTYCRRMRRAP